MFSLFEKKQFLDKGQQQQVVAAISEAEAMTSGEIRVFMEPHCAYVDTMERAREVFASLQMEKTVERNAVLVYIAFRDREFALFGDSAIYEKAGGPEFWKKAAAGLSGRMREGQYVEGLRNCIGELGKALAAHFPPDPNINKNELPDEIVFGK
ncbi:MAG: TPM domain-containing protein [Taibaiella sp.]|nr:TPM domain-containing protein [Taibaiella sp.]